MALPNRQTGPVPFVRLPSEWLDRPEVLLGLPPWSLHVALQLARCCDGTAWSGKMRTATLVKRCRLPRSTVYESLRALVEAGLIERENRSPDFRIVTRLSGAPDIEVRDPGQRSPADRTTKSGRPDIGSVAIRKEPRTSYLEAAEAADRLTAVLGERSQANAAAAEHDPRTLLLVCYTADVLAELGKIERSKAGWVRGVLRRLEDGEPFDAHPKAEARLRAEQAKASAHDRERSTRQREQDRAETDQATVQRVIAGLSDEQFDEFARAAVARAAGTFEGEHLGRQLSNGRSSRALCDAVYALVQTETSR
ncbi:MAG: helix-turn-helix domain-containing protein [Phycisphaerales bacterium]